MARTSTMLAIWAIGVVLAVAGCGPAGSSLATEAEPGRAAAGTWRELPGSPLGPREAAIGLWTGSEVLLIGGSDESPCPPNADCPVHRTRLDGAALDPAAGSWRRLPDSGLLSTGPWLVTDGRLVNPTIGSADGGRVNNWGRAYPNGCSLDPRTGIWSPLPASPWVDQAAGARGPSAAMFVDATGAVLDTADDRWRLLPALPDSHLTSATVLAAGTALLVFGGVRWNAAGTTGTLSNRAWLLTD